MAASLQAAQLFGVAGKRVLVTGGGSGIGAMMAAGFAANGASVIIASRNAEALAATAAEVKKTTSADIETVVADLGSRAGCEALEMCRTYARTNRELGFWGGESESERSDAGFPPTTPIIGRKRVAEERARSAMAQAS